MDLAKVRKIVDRVSSGPWTQTWNSRYGVRLWDGDKQIICTEDGPLKRSLHKKGGPAWQKDFEFIRCAREHMERLLAIAEAAVRQEAAKEQICPACYYRDSMRTCICTKLYEDVCAAQNDLNSLVKELEE